MIKMAPLARVSAAAIGLAALLGTMAASTSRSAASPATILTPAQIVLSATPVTYPNQQVTLTGTLETAGQDPQGLSGQKVSVTFFYGPNAEQVATLTTGSGGQFGWTQTVPVPGAFTAYFGGGSGYGPAGSEVWPVPTQQFPARIVLSPIAPVAYLSMTSVTGQLLMKLPDGSWVPSAYAKVALCSPNNYFYTDANGNFSSAIQANPATDQCTLTTPGNAGSDRYQWSGSAAAVPVVVPLTADPTAFVNIMVSSPVPVSQLSFGAHIVSLTATGSEPDYPGPIQLQYQAPGTQTWRLISTSHQVHDWVSFAVAGYLPGGGIAAGNWRLVVIPLSANYLGISSTPYPVVVRVPTMLGARIRGHELTGWLSYLAHAGPIGGASVMIEKLTSGRWRRVAMVRTSAGGTYAYRVGRSGTYRAVYGGAKLPGAQAGYGTFSPSYSHRVTLG
jgi:hypothetical protein